MTISSHKLSLHDEAPLTNTGTIIVLWHIFVTFNWLLAPQLCFWYVDDPGTHIPNPDGQLHVYFLPIGQGDATVIQCPSGTLNDWGSSNSRGERFWAGPELRDHLAGRIGDIRSVLVTHHHWDHYSLLPDTFPSEAELSGLEHRIIGQKCIFEFVGNFFSFSS